MAMYAMARELKRIDEIKLRITTRKRKKKGQAKKMGEVENAKTVPN